MSYIALVNLFNYQEKSFFQPPPLFRLTWNGIGSIVSACVLGPKHGRITPGVERGNNGPTSDIICLASPPLNLKSLAILRACGCWSPPNQARLRLVWCALLSSASGGRWGGTAFSAAEDIIHPRIENALSTFAQRLSKTDLPNAIEWGRRRGLLFTRFSPPGNPFTSRHPRSGEGEGEDEGAKT